MLLIKYRKIITPFYRKLMHRAYSKSKKQCNAILIKCRSYSANPNKNEADLKINVESLKTSNNKTLNEKVRKIYALFLDN